MTRLHPLLLPALLLASACALSPQVVDIHPNLNVSPVDNMASRRVAVQVEVRDQRTEKVIGSRGGVYSETALITAAADMTATIREAVAAQLIKLGYHVDTTASVALTVGVSELLYASRVDKAITTVTTTANIQATCRNGGTTMENSYRVADSEEFLKPLSENRNRDLINATLSSALERMLRDQALLACLNR